MKRGRIGKRIVAGALTLSLTACLPAGALSGWFNQPSGWAAADLERAEAEELVIPWRYESDLQGDITRQEFASLAVALCRKVGGLEVDIQSLGQPPFTDIQTASNYNDVAAAWQLGLMNGVSATEFAPNRTITRMEICTLLSRVMEKCGVALPETVSGVEERLDSGAEGVVPDWARGGVAEIVGAGLMQGGDNGSLALSAQTTREQAMVLALRAMDLGKDILEEESFTAAERAQIAKLRELRTTFGNPGQPYAQAPSVSAPYSPGVLNDAFLQDGLNSINYIRAVAGLNPVSMSQEKNQNAQVGAMLIAAGEFSHYPSQPAGMPDDLYQQGYAATSSSNIGKGHYSLSDFNLSCADDSDPSNIAILGHRRWLLDPTLTTVGMGYAERCSLTQVIEEGYVEWNGPDYVTWPSEGVFPMEQFHGDLAWSCSLSPNKYTLNRESLSVTVTDASGHSWTGRVSEQTDLSADFVLTSGSSYGSAPAVIFRPAGLEYRIGQPLTVTISGLQLVGGGTDTITYTVKLF